MPLPPEPTRNPKGRKRTHGTVPPILPVLPRSAFRPMEEDPPEPDEPDWRVEGYVPPAHDGGLSDGDRELLKTTIAEIARRGSEALRLFEPMPEQERFFASHAGERIALGGNRGGKTTATCVEIARAVTGQDPYDKYPKTNGRVIMVGRDLKHLSKVFFEKMFKPGAFKVIRDLESGEWRAYRPLDPSDLSRADQAKQSPPLIPSRFFDYSKIAWENKKENIPNTITFNNGWEVYFFSALGTIPQGWDVDMVVFDEEIVVHGWYTEMAARLVDRRTEDPITGHVRSGKFLWSATPQAGTQQLFDLKNRADEQREHEIDLMSLGQPIPRPTIEAFQFGLLDNVFMSEKAVQELIDKYSGNPEEYEVRIKGNFALMGSRIYSEFFPKGVHGIEPLEMGADWTRYIAIDPGYQVCACLFVAIPPPGHWLGDKKVIYDELYIKKCSGPVLAARLKAKIGSDSIHKFIIDHRAGGQHDFTSGKTNEENYSAAFKAEGLHCEVTGSAFTWSADDPKAGIEAVRQGLRITAEGSDWVVIKGKVPWMIWEAERYAYKKNPDKTPSDEPVKLNDHLMDCWRYLAMAVLKWIKPRVRKRKLGYTIEAINAKKARAKAKGGSDAGKVKLY